MRARPLLLAALLLAPLAAADHTFSHRAYVVGRVLDVEGKPAPGLAVNVTFEGARATGRCFDSREERTGPMGDYEVCRHVHEIAPNATVTVRVGGAERTVPLDHELRHAVASLQLPEPSPHVDVNGERAFARSFVVTGRAFELLPRTTTEEGIPVDARPMGGEVNVTLRAGGEVRAQASAKTDEHGRYVAELLVGELPPGAVVRAALGRDGAEELASSLYRRADVNVLRDSRLAFGPGADAPGTATPAGAWTGLVALAAVALALGRGRVRR